MATPTLDKILKNKSQALFFEVFVKDNKLEPTLSFVTQKTDPKTAYDAIFSPSARHGIKGIDASTIDSARKVYNTILDVMAEKGLKASEAHKQASQNKYITKRLSEAKTSVLAEWNSKLIPAFLQSTKYCDYVETQVDGPNLAGQLGMDASSAKDLAWAKVMLILGNDSTAKSSIKSAIKAHNLKTKVDFSSRKATKLNIPTEKNVLAALKKIKISV